MTSNNPRVPDISISTLLDSFTYIGKNNLISFMQKNGIETLKDLLAKSVGDTEWYWHAVNTDLNLRWKRPFTKVLDIQKGLAWPEWFRGGKCNIIDSVIQKNIDLHPNKTAFIFVNEYGIQSQISFKDLGLRVKIFANALSKIGVKKGDIVGVYAPMNIRSFIAIYSISLVGAVHVPIFSGFGKVALEQRLIDSKAQFLISAETMRRKGKTISLRDHWNSTFETTGIKKIVLLDNKVIDTFTDGKILSFEKMYENSLNDFGIYDMGALSTQSMDSGDPLFILYTSGTTGKPKGTIQTHGGFLVFSAHQSAYLIDLRVDDVLFWYADMGWITGQTWVVYGSPIIGATTVVFEDTLDFPYVDYWAKYIERLKVTVFGMAPTAIRQFMRNDINFSKYDFRSLRLLVSTGERLNKEAWEWYFEKIGNSKCSIINLTGGTEVGGAILSMFPFLKKVPSSVGVPVPGLDADIYDDYGNSAKEGYLVVKKPWPGMTKGLLNDDKRYIDTYWSKFPNVWYHGDKVTLDDKYMWYITGRVDDVIKISGHRVDPGEIEQVVTRFPEVIESAAVGIPDEITGESIYVYCVLRNNNISEPNLFIVRENIQRLLISEIGKFLLPKSINFVFELPKNRSGKILRRLIRQRIMNEKISENDLLLVENPESLKNI